MTQNPKTQKMQICVFVQNHKKWEWKYLRFAAFEAITFEPIKIQTHLASQNDRLSLSFVKNEDTHSKKNGQKRSYNSYLRVSFISDHS